LQKAYDRLRVNYDHTKDEMLILKKKNADLQSTMKEMAPVNEARDAHIQLNKVREEHEATRAALLSYKSMHNVVCS
jgi:hypothetical protein